MKHVGFTGTQEGMTAEQQASLAQVLRDEFEPDARFHHGDCIGADSQAHDIARGIGYRVWSHPPYRREKRAFRTAQVYSEPKPYMERNQDIVNACELVIGAPFATADQQRYSGTHATIRRARKGGRRVVVVWPDGNTQYENWTPERGKDATR